ncbi:MAG: FtsB family cell division protein [Ilumatobacteraceae bacterium]
MSTRRTASAERRRDLTKAIPVERRLVEGRRKRWLVYGGSVTLFVAFAAVLFVLPVQAWFRQQDDISRKQEELAALERANAELNEEVAKLNTPEGIEEAAREEIGYVRRGEIQLTVLPLPAAPTALPGGWPFDAAAQILTLRGASAAPIADAPAAESGGAVAPVYTAPLGLHHGAWRVGPGGTLLRTMCQRCVGSNGPFPSEASVFNALSMIGGLQF